MKEREVGERVKKERGCEEGEERKRAGGKVRRGWVDRGQRGRERLVRERVGVNRRQAEHGEGEGCRERVR